MAAPQSLGNILHAPDGYACQIHLNESFFHAALPAAIPLNNGGFKRDFFEFWNLESNPSRSGSDVEAVVAAAVALTMLVTLVPGSGIVKKTAHPTGQTRPQGFVRLSNVCV